MDAAHWSATKARLEARGLWGAGASLSLRVAGDETMWLGDEHDAAQSALRLRYPQYLNMELHDLPVIAVRIQRASSWGALD